jgi:hypothetical protein
MPNVIELLKAEGLDITSELEAKLPTLIEASDEVRNLVTAKNDLLKYKQDNAEKIAGFDDMQTKYESELNERELVAKENNDYKAQIEIIQERNARQDEIIESRNKQAIAATRDAGELEIAGMFGCKDTGRMLAKNFLSTDIGEDGNVSKTYQLNGEKYDNFDSFKTAATKVEYLAKQMAAPQSSGVDGSGTGGSHKSSQDTPQGRLSERLKQKGLIK